MSHIPSVEAVSDPSPAVSGGAFGRKGIGWAVFEWSRNPYYNVVVMAVFAPYFATHVVNNGAMGQTLVGLTITIAGIIMAFVAPILGAITDKGGRKKPFILIAILVLVVCGLCLGTVTPGLSAAVPVGMFLMIIGYCAYTVLELLHNAMLPGAGAPKSLPMISGLGLSLGNAAGVTMLALIVLATQAELFGLSGPDIARLSAPAVALWISLFIGLFFWLMPDVYRPGATWRGALEDSLAPANRIDPVSWIIGKFRHHPNIMRYLAGRMIYADGVAALLTLGSVYVAGHLGWSGEQTALLGIVSFIFAVPGGFFGGFLDRTFGPKRALMIELSAIIGLAILQLSITQDAILFGLIPAQHEVWPGGMFPHLSDLAYVALIIPASLFMVACISSSRYMLVHIAPPDKVGEFFGFYAMAGSVTVWIGPGLVALVTWLSNDQRIGFASVLALLIAGLLVISTVHADKTPEHLKSGD